MDSPFFSGMKNYAFHLARGDISICMGMVSVTIGKAEVNFMGDILQQILQFCEGRIGFFGTVSAVFFVEVLPAFGA